MPITLGLTDQDHPLVAVLEKTRWHALNLMANRRPDNVRQIARPLLLAGSAQSLDDWDAHLIVFISKVPSKYQMEIYNDCHSYDKEPSDKKANSKQCGVNIAPWFWIFMK